MIWLAGHALRVQDALCARPLTGGSDLPEGWQPQFSQHGDPVASQSEWPDRTLLEDLLSKQRRCLIELIDQMHDDQPIVNANDP